MDLKELRKSLGYSQNEFAILLKIPLRTYKRLEIEDSYKTSWKYEQAFNQAKLIKRKNLNVGQNCIRKIFIIGAGFVGLATGLILGRNNDVTFLDNDQEKIKNINESNWSKYENNIKKFVKENKIKFRASNNNDDIKRADVCIICLPTDYDQNIDNLNTSLIDEYVGKIFKLNKKCPIIIKSTLPVGCCEKLHDKFKDIKLIYMPEFLKESTFLDDSLHPDRVIVGLKNDSLKIRNYVKKLFPYFSDTVFLFTNLKEAESIKLFSNTYLAMRVSFFNELDSFALENKIDASKIIKGLSLDQRIGDYYNSPSFGFGGYCLPKDSASLSNSLNNVNSKLINSIKESNDSRLEYLYDYIKKSRVNIKTLVFYIPYFDNKRSLNYSCLYKLYLKAKNNGYNTLVIKGKDDSNLTEYCNKADLILIDKFENALFPYKNKIFCRDYYIY